MSTGICRSVPKRLLAILHSSFLNRRPKFNPFNIFETLPPELITIILTFLLKVDHVCFSLSCKYTFYCFQSYVKSRGGTISQLLPLRKRPVLSSNSAKWSRTKLLVRLQNNRWKYCKQCWTLHPYSAWMALRSNWKLCQQPCSSKCSLVEVESWKCSSLYAGEVQICPCQAITFHQGQHIAEYCRGSRSDLRLDHSSFKVAPRLDGGRKILHSCSVTTNEATLYVFSTIKVCNCCNHLRVTNQFSLRVHDPSPSYFVRVARYWYCPERWIEKFVGEAGSEFNWDLFGDLFGDLFSDLIHVHCLA